MGHHVRRSTWREWLVVVLGSEVGLGLTWGLMLLKTVGGRGLVGGLLFGLVFGLFGVLYVVVTERTSQEWRERLGNGRVIGTVVGLGAGLKMMGIGVIVGLVGGLLVGLVNGLYERGKKKRTFRGPEVAQDTSSTWWARVGGGVFFGLDRWPIFVLLAVLSLGGLVGVLIAVGGVEQPPSDDILNVLFGLGLLLLFGAPTFGLASGLFMEVEELRSSPMARWVHDRIACLQQGPQGGRS